MTKNHPVSESEQTSHLHVVIRRELHRQLRARAIQKGRPLGDLVADAVATYLEQEGGAR